MPTQLDKDISRITQAVTAPGQMFELTETTRRGVTMPAFKNAPPSLALAAPALHGERDLGSFAHLPAGLPPVAPRTKNIKFRKT